jgi:hypothetical protein
MPPLTPEEEAELEQWRKEREEAFEAITSLPRAERRRRERELKKKYY